MFLLKNKANSKQRTRLQKNRSSLQKEKQSMNKIENLKIIICNPTTKIDHNFATIILLSILSFYLHHLHPTILHLTPLGIRQPVMGADTKGKLTLSSGLCCSSTGFPCPQAALAAVSGVVSGFGQRCPDIMVLLPPCMFLIVAVWQ